MPQVERSCGASHRSHAWYRSFKNCAKPTQGGR